MRRSALSPRVRRAVAAALGLALLLPQAATGQPDDAIDTDRRELAEELGLDPADPALDAVYVASSVVETSESASSRAASAAEAGDALGQVGPFDAESPTGRWIVVLDDPAVAAYEGGLKGLAATSPQATGEERLDVEDPRSVAYAEHLEATHAEVVADVSEVLGADVTVTHDYVYSLNGMAMEMSSATAAEVAELPGIAQVLPDEINELDTDTSNELINSPAIWGGSTGTGLGTRGEGVVVAMIDSGVNPDHPSFAATDGDGYTHTNPYGSGNYVGLCAPDSPNHQDVCNDKLIGVYNYTTATWEDTDGHGSHTGSTMGGNKHQAQFTVGSTDWDLTVQGVAPRANVISYKICAPGCATSYAVAAVNQAIIDGVDVLNYSISGPDSPWGNAVDLAFLNAFEAGIFVSASAGNDGPGASTAAKTAPWNATVAASNNTRLIAQSLAVTGPAPVPEELAGMAAVPGTGPATTSPVSGSLLAASVVAPSNPLGCAAFPAGAFEGSLALIARGDCTFEEKVVNAQNAGATGVVVTNNFPGPPIVMGALEATTVPAVMVSQEVGAVLQEFVVAHPDTQVTLDSASVQQVEASWATMVADFSSRGPSRYDLLAPTFTAPGRNILAATAASDGDAVQYEFMQGTSMASPHGAGSGALLRALHPEWSPAMIRSALASTANPTGMVKEDGATPANAFDIGSGLLDLDAAGRVGLVLDETTDNFRAANPTAGGDPRTLNLPAITDNDCSGVCTFTRTVTSVADVPASWTVDVQTTQGMGVTVAPTTFTLEPGATQEITVTTDVASLSPTDGWQFGDLQITTDAVHSNGSAVAGVHYPVAVLPVNPVMAVTPAAITSTQGVDRVTKHPVTVANTGTSPLAWHVTEEPEGCALPAWLSTDPASGEVAVRRNQVFTALLDSSDLPGGTYEATLCVAGNDPTNPTARVAVTMTVEEIPAVTVTDAHLDVSQPADSTAYTTLGVTNAGYGPLTWTFNDPDVGPSQQRVDMMREGVLLTPGFRGPRNIVALDAEDGSLVDSTFIPSMPSGTALTVLPLPDNTGVLVNDQVSSVIYKYDLDGNYVGIFAPRHGTDPEIMRNVRGMTWSPQGTLVVAAFGLSSQGDPNINSLLEFDDQGNYLGVYVASGLDGLNQPWSPLFRDDDLLVSASGGRAVHSYSLDGQSVNDRFTTRLSYAVQLDETAADTVVAANWSTTGAYLPAGVHEFDADGSHIWSGTIPGATDYSGVHELGDGRLLVSTGQGTYALDRDGSYEQTYSGQRTRMIQEARMPDAATCRTPADVPWLSVDPGAGSTLRGETTEVTVATDSSGLVDGEYAATLCLSTDDPIRPYVPVTVTMTVTRPDCDTTYSGAVCGGATITDVACFEAGTTVNGAVKVQPGAMVFADAVRFNGKFEAKNAEWIEITDSQFNGSPTITGTQRKLVLDGNTVSSTLTVDRNSTGEVPIVIAENTIGKDLKCSGNDPAPTNDGRPNVVAGSRTGQCAGL